MTLSPQMGMQSWKLHTDHCTVTQEDGTSLERTLGKSLMSAHKAQDRDHQLDCLEVQQAKINCHGPIQNEIFESLVARSPYGEFIGHG